MYILNFLPIFLLYDITMDELFGIAVVAAFVLLFAAAAVRDRNRKKQKKEVERRYREQNILTVYLTDAVLGTIEADYNVSTWELKAGHADLPAFGSQKPSVVIAEGYLERDESVVMRSIGIAYSRSRDILEKLAEIVVQELQLEDEDSEEIPSTAEITALIRITEFHFVLEGEEKVMQVIGGVDIDIMTFGVNALYRIDEEKWEYDAERIGG